MKDDQPKTKPLIGKDELNLCECPLTLLTDSAEKGQKTLEFTDKQNDIIRHWTITGSDKYGLPCAYDEPVYIAMLALTKIDKFKSRKVYFNPYEMLKLMKWPTSGKYYTRLELALKRLHGVSIYVDYLWDRGEFKRRIQGEGFHIIDKFIIIKGKKSIKNSYYQWDEDIFESFLSGNIKNLDLDTYFSLSTAISRRFFRLWDKRLYKNDCISFDLQELCHEKLGISRNLKYPSLLKQALKPTLKEYIEKKLLSSAVYRKTKGGRWILTVKKHKEESVQIQPPAEEEPTTPKCSLINQMVSIGVARAVAVSLVNRIDSEIIESQLEALPYRKNIDDKPAFLVRAIQENYPLPEQIQKRRAAKKREEEES